ncbi:PP2C family protein-serine/threonine phosphatase [Streptomyces albipurpureus]|uniref:Serine/threonine-protein phosphatase n=1 Tax=Streptomyces albipurpureus TaxID=2897419 RepID=A0ABT0UT49_9ACTN|nr:PP2C family protein-serine/threonine phosphatase [Streptomyces sp. CWNU-1]MCM2391416.1 serine/threonine-protein phosphatase [Streptomyces sp. CWNU-1]
MSAPHVPKVAGIDSALSSSTHTAAALPGIPAVPAPLEDPSEVPPGSRSGAASDGRTDEPPDHASSVHQGLVASPSTVVQDRLAGWVSDLTALQELTERLARTSSLDTALQELLEAGAALLGARRGMVVLEPQPGPGQRIGAGLDDRTCRFGTDRDPLSRRTRIKGLGLTHAELGHIETIPRAATAYGQILAHQGGNPDTRRGDSGGDHRETAPEGGHAPGDQPHPGQLDGPDRLIGAMRSEGTTRPCETDASGGLGGPDGSGASGSSSASGGSGGSDGLPRPICLPDLLGDTSLDPRLREVAVRLGYAASYTQPLASESAGILGATVWLYDEPATPQKRQCHLVDLYTRYATEHLARLLELEQARETMATIAEELLPSRLPRLPGVQLAARHRTGPLGGGDWYDALPLPEGALGLAVGSVSGSGPSALAAMGRLRASLRAYAVMEGEDPVAVLSDLELLLRLTEPARTATALFAYAEPAAGKMVLAGAGHTPPLVIGERRTEFVETSLSAPLGMLACWEAPSVELTPEPGETVLLYTDGLLRCTGDPMDRAFARLHTAAASVPKAARRNPGAIADHVLKELLPEGLDHSTIDEDIVLLAVCFD